MSGLPPSDGSGDWVHPDAPLPPDRALDATRPAPSGSWGAPAPLTGAYASPPPPPPPGGSGQPGFGPPGYGTPGYGQPSYTPYGGAASQSKLNGFAVASLVTGIVGCAYITPILAVIFGFVARRQIRNSGGTQRGAGFALAGIILGGVWIALLATVIVLGVTGQFDEEPAMSRSEFVRHVSDEVASSDQAARLATTPEKETAVSLASDEFASCLYDVYVDEPAVLNDVYDAPLAESYETRGLSKSRIAELERLAVSCATDFGNTMAAIALR